MTVVFNHSAPPGTGEDAINGKRLLPLVDAMKRASALACPVNAVEDIGLLQAPGRVLARSLRARHDMPLFDNSAMDGFAVNTRDLTGSGPYCLRLSGLIAAGDREGKPLQPGTCAEILTGARIPDGADAVVPVEVTDVADGQITFDDRPWPGAHIRCKGQDLAHRSVLVAQGVKLASSHIGLLAANGISRIKVYRRPRVAVFSTGNELVAPGGRLSSGKIHDCNRPMLLSMLEGKGLEVTDLGIVRDNETAIAELIRDAGPRFDLILSSGSVSVGRCDVIKQSLIRAGGTLHAWKVAVKPGKPVAFGTLENAVFLGLPGNPFAAWIGMALIGKVIIQRLLGLPLRIPPATVATAGSFFPHRPGRVEYVPVRTGFENGSLRLYRIHGGSGTLFPVSQADGLAVIRAEQGNVDEGGILDFVEFDNGEMI